MSIAFLARLILTLHLFVVFNVHQGVDATVWVSLAFDLRRLVHFDVLLLLQAVIEGHVPCLAIGALVAPLLPLLDAFFAEHCTLAASAAYGIS